MHFTNCFLFLQHAFIWQNQNQFIKFLQILCSTDFPFYWKVILEPPHFSPKNAKISKTNNIEILGMMSSTCSCLSYVCAKFQISYFKTQKVINVVSPLFLIYLLSPWLVQRNDPKRRKTLNMWHKTNSERTFYLLFRQPFLCLKEKIWRGDKFARAS